MKKIILFIALFLTFALQAQEDAEYLQRPPTQFKSGIAIQRTLVDPTGVIEGQITWNIPNKRFRQYNGTTWEDLDANSINPSDLETTQKINLGNIGNTPIEDAFNAFTFTELIQGIEDGYVLISAIENNDDVEYLFTGVGGGYGSTGSLVAINDDFVKLNTDYGFNDVWRILNSTLPANSYNQSISHNGTVSLKNSLSVGGVITSDYQGGLLQLQIAGQYGTDFIGGNLNHSKYRFNMSGTVATYAGSRTWGNVEIGRTINYPTGTGAVALNSLLFNPNIDLLNADADNSTLTSIRINPSYSNFGNAKINAIYSEVGDVTFNNGNLFLPDTETGTAVKGLGLNAEGKVIETNLDGSTNNNIPKTEITTLSFTPSQEQVNGFDQFFIPETQTGDTTFIIDQMTLTSDVNFITIQNLGTGTLTIQAGAGVTFTTLVTDTNKVISLKSYAPNVWVVGGLEIEGIISNIQQTLVAGNAITAGTDILFEGAFGNDTSIGVSGNGMQIKGNSGLEFTTLDQANKIMFLPLGLGIYSNIDYSNADFSNTTFSKRNAFAQIGYVDDAIAAAGVGSSLSDGDKGDVVVSSSGSVWTLDTSSVNSLKIQNGTVSYSDIDATLKTRVDLANTALQPGVIIDEDNMISDSNTRVPTQQSVRAFVLANSGGGSGGDLTKVLNVAALRAFTVAPANNSLFYLEGHTTEGYGSGFFKWISASTNTDDNGYVIKATSITTGRFEKVVDDTPQITDFGGLPDYVNTGDDTQAFLDLYEYIRNNPHNSAKITGGQYRVTQNINTNEIDGSNVFFEGDCTGSILIESTNANQAVTTGRGNLFNFADGTTDFTWSKIDVHVHEDNTMNNFQQGVFLGKYGNLDNLKFENFSLTMGVKADNLIGVSGFNFWVDELAETDTDVNGTITIDGVNLRLYGNNMYGARFLRQTDVVFNNNRFQGSAWTDGANDSFNAFAPYGNSTVTGYNNWAWEWGHSPFAFSMCNTVNFSNFRVWNVGLVSEAGIEVEYKDEHGFDDVQTENINIYDGYVSNCDTGILITEIGDSATSIAPRNVNISDIHIKNSTTNDVYIGTDNTSTNFTASEITNIKLENITAISPSASVGLRIKNGRDIKIVDCTFDGQTRNAIIGRNATILPDGLLEITGTKFLNSTLQAVFIESFGGTLRFKDNELRNMGDKAFQATTLIGANSRFIIEGNNLYGENSGTEGFRISANVPLSRFINNYCEKFTGKGNNVSMTESVLNYNMVNDCGTASTYVSAITPTGNYEK